MIKCVPNFSEGREKAVVQTLADAVTSVAGVVLLDRTMDADHHRSVLTFVGPSDAVAEAAFRAVHVASQRIDLQSHVGGHPRIGAADVVPFVPIEDATMADCIRVAKQVGRRIGAELEIPVLFYEEAATHPVRRTLEAIRRGGLAGLTERMERESEWYPDCGPGRPHPTAGVTVVGARPLLVAFNVNLASRDLMVARSIAKAIRSSNGGLAAVKAIGVDLPSRGQVQVSMNLIDIDVTPIHTAFDAVCRHAAQAGVAIASSELIGLVPQRALLPAAQAALQLDAFTSDQILEVKLARARAGTHGFTTGSFTEFLSTLGSIYPTPAGASVAGLVGAMTARLGAKVLRVLARKRERSLDVHQAATLDRLGDELCRLAEADVPAYDAVLEARRRPSSDSGRDQALAEALAYATEIPLRMAETIVQIHVVLSDEPGEQGAAIKTDRDVARTLAQASLRALLLVVDKNMKDHRNHVLNESMQSRCRKIQSYLEGLKSLC